MEPIALTLGQKFEIEKFSRNRHSDDVQALRGRKDLLVAWKQQQAASAWALRQSRVSDVFIPALQQLWTTAK